MATLRFTASGWPSIDRRRPWILEGNRLTALGDHGLDRGAYRLFPGALHVPDRVQDRERRGGSSAEADLLADVRELSKPCLASTFCRSSGTRSSPRWSRHFSSCSLPSRALMRLALYRPKKWKDILFFFISTRFLPVAGVIVPLYVIFSPTGDPALGGRGLNLLGTLPGLILLYTAMNLPIAVWMLRSFFEEVPRDVLDAARVDGAGLPREMLQIVLPMVAPGSRGNDIHLDHLCLERVLPGIQPGAKRIDRAHVHGSLRDVGRTVLGKAGRVVHDGGVPDRRSSAGWRSGSWCAVSRWAP